MLAQPHSSAWCLYNGITYIDGENIFFRNKFYVSPSTNILLAEVSPGENKMSPYMQLIC